MKNDQEFKRIFIGIMVMLLLWNAYLTYQLYELRQNPTSNTNSPEHQVIEKHVSEFETDATRVVDAVQDKVVSVINYDRTEAIGSGSGIIYSNEKGVVRLVTNHHVIENGSRYVVRLSNGEEIDAELIGSDQYTDLAMLEINADIDIEAITIGDSNLSRVGEFVLAIGSPVDLEFANSVTFGVISGKDRIVPVDLNGDTRSDWDMIVMQTDAAINPGNSGGALVNMEGELIGINSMKLSSDNVEGMGFAIPISEAIPILQQISETGEVRYPLLGISALSVDDLTQFERNRFKISADITEGVFIAGVTSDGAAKAAGIQEGDVMVSYDGVTIDDFKTFRRQLYKNKVGDTVEIVVMRNGESKNVTVTLK
ncbi:PDZ domain-containing protein [Erysipelothrix sp. HDW6C]|uniref:S1C family serine protease n=1 Tax=Erysipelothrix sp. HDW6C TaxID=2714930 RepID=UPI00140C1169|nr:trypsin-like peptidase domain-containing protein [Erysipelothrix sp. HDW6C]QIK68921.1 PDZ domain-containing protein [Erysipelothrix sp. HDW6C]